MPKKKKAKKRAFNYRRKAKAKSAAKRYRKKGWVVAVKTHKVRGKKPHYTVLLKRRSKTYRPKKKR
jgi:hypothetical protein